MFRLSDAFRRYVALAEPGRALWRLVLGVLVVVACWLATTVGAMTLGLRLSGAGREGGGPLSAVSDFMGSAGGVAAALASFVGMSAGVFIAVRVVHRRPAGSVLGAAGRLDWSGFARGFAAALIASALAEAPNLLVDSSVGRSDLSFGLWLLLLVPMLVLLFIQVSAEELAFRGYLLQSLAARFRSPLVWALLPGLLFTALHWTANATVPMMAAMLVAIAAFAFTATVLVIRTGNLGAGIGAHLGLNLFGILVVSHQSWLSGVALYRGRPLDMGDWTAAQAVLVAVFGAAPFLLVLLLLLWRRSPLRVVRD